MTRRFELGRLEDGKLAITHPDCGVVTWVATDINGDDWFSYEPIDYRRSWFARMFTKARRIDKVVASGTWEAMQAAQWLMEMPG